MIKYVFFFMFLGIPCAEVFAQQKFKIVMIDAINKKPVSGANFKILGAKPTSQSTDQEGALTIINHLGDTRVNISAVGYHLLDTTLNFTLTGALILKLIPQTTFLDEVIVNTGYQKIAKERTAGSFQQINNEQFNSQVGTQVLARLEAIGSSLKVDRSISENQLNIRGISSINGPRNVLIVLDNFPYEGDLAQINPNDVEGITILKDAAATSIWGARAGNGVIVITTKSANYQQALKININANTTIGGIPDLMKLPLMATRDLIVLEKQLFKADRYKTDYNSPNKPALSPVVEILYNDNLSASEKDNLMNSLADQDVRNDYSKYFYQKSLNQQYAINLNAGSEKFKWTTSVGYDQNKSNLAATYNRTTIRFGSEYKLLKNLTLQTSFTYTDVFSKSGKPELREITSAKGILYPYARFADAEGNALPIVKDYNFSYISAVGNGKLLDWKYYPLTDYLHHTATFKSKDILINTGLQYKFNRFILDVKYQFEKQDGNNEALQGLESYAARNLINSYTQINPDGTIFYPIPKGDIRDQSLAVLQSYNLRGQLSYQYQKENHSFDVMGGGEIRAVANEGSQFRYYGYNPAISIQEDVNYKILYPNFINGSNSYLPSANSLSATANRFVSVYGNASYSYLKRYILYLSARRDASNIFGVSTNDKWKPLWSAALAWIISDADFYKFESLPYLKARISYGSSGNIDPSKTAVTTIRYASTSPYTQTPYAVVDKFYNPELRWEEVKMLNIGLDFNAFKSRLKGSIEYFFKNATDLFGVYPIDYTAGVGSFAIKNIGAMKGHGLDISLNTINTKGKINWQSNLNFSTYKDKVTAYYLQGSQASNLVSGSVPTFSGIVGKPVYGMFSYQWAGLDSEFGDPQGILDGVKSKDYLKLMGSGTQTTDLVYHGSAIPLVFGNIGNQFTIGKATLAIQLTYKFGHFFRAPSINYTELIASGNGHADYSKRWQVKGDEQFTNVPSFRYPNVSNRDAFYLGSAALVQRADHVRLQYINFSYQLINAQKGYLKNLDVYANVANLGVVWQANKANIDPEYNGINRILPPKTISFGTKITF